MARIRRKSKSRKKVIIKRKSQPVKIKTIKAVATNVVKNNQEMLKRQVGPENLAYLDGNLDDGPPTTSYKGLNTRGPFNFILNPLNYGWENDDSSTASDHFTGKGIHPRYLKSRLKFSFPEGEQSIIKPMRIQLVWGFVKRPAMLTEYTTPKALKVSRLQLSQLFMHQVEPEFDQASDQMRFQTRRPTNYVITGKRWIRPDRRYRIGAPQQQSWHDQAIVGGPPEVMETISWKMGRQWRLQKSTTDEAETDVFHYNNEQWAPFIVIYNPDYCNVKQAAGATCGGGEEDNPVPEPNRIQCQHVHCMWYSDA